MPKRPKRRLLDTLSTRQLAQAIGVSESSVKRWVDDGALSAVRTVGRHRRIPVAEAMRFVRDTSAHLVRPAALGLAAGAISAVDGDAGDTADRLTEWLLAGAGPEVRDLLQGLYLRGRSIAAIIDGPLRTAMRRVGERWRHDPEGVLMEHRATDICAQWLHQLRARLPVDADAPVSVGGAPPGDPYVLPSLAVAAALAAEGFRAVNLGAETPLETLALACRREHAVIVWLSVSVEAARDQLARDLPALTDAARAAGARLVLGGRALEERPLAVPAGVQVAATVGEGAAFARGLRAGAAAP